MNQQPEKYTDLGGIWKAELPGGLTGELHLPGTLDESGLGFTDTGENAWKAGELQELDAKQEAAESGTEAKEEKSAAEPAAGMKKAEGKAITTRFRRRVTFTGQARISRTIRLEHTEGFRLFVDVERSRCLRLFVDGTEYKAIGPQTIATPSVFEITGVGDGEHEFVFLSDNSYPGLPAEDILYSSAATDETQTNWNGLLGFFRLRREEPVFISSLRVCPADDARSLRLKVHIDAKTSFSGILIISSEALKEDVILRVNSNDCTILLNNLRDDLRRWDIDEGFLYRLEARLKYSCQPDAVTGALRCADQEKTGEAPSCSLASGRDENPEQAIRKPFTVSFGLRSFSASPDGHLCLNGRKIFLLAEANCAVFPETGHPPMDEGSWEKILLQYRSYGVNCMRFHSHTPPEAAFEAADRLGMLMQAELDCWNPKNAFEDDGAYVYYHHELEQILLRLANHPSFVMLTFGNELQAGEKGRARMSEMLDFARKTDAARLYANGSNTFYGAIGCDDESSFFTSQGYKGLPLRGTFADMHGHINECYPNTMTDYSEALTAFRAEEDNGRPSAADDADGEKGQAAGKPRKPVFSFEVGQFEILPDFDEIEEFHGVTLPENYEVIRERAARRAISPEEWKRQVEATGCLSQLCYREEVEAALRTDGLSGISLLGLQDFPGQGTALVGMMNSHLQPKPFDFARPEAFARFFRNVLPLALLKKYTYRAGEDIPVTVKLANYGKADINGTLSIQLTEKLSKNAGKPKIPAAEGVSCAGQSGDTCNRDGEKSSAACSSDNELSCGSIIREISCGMVSAPQGRLTWLGSFTLKAPETSRPLALTLTVRVGALTNSYPVWVYPAVDLQAPEDVYETRSLDEKALAVLAAGGKVFLAPDSDKKSLPKSIKGQFSTDFWSVGTFAGQEGGMGQLIDDRHPVFRYFPTSFHTDWQWWPMASARAVILPRRLKTIVAELDSYAFLRPMAQLVECRVGAGRLLVSTFGLHNLRRYPEAEALLAAIYRYLTSDDFTPGQELSVQELREMFTEQ